MSRKKFAAAWLVACAIALTAFSLANAWPDLPPAKAFVSGPGIVGQAQITDRTVLDVLRLGSIEDMEHGVIARPNLVGDGFRIIRYFEGGEFRFADLTYYPNALGTRSVVYFQDGPMLSGDHTPYNNKWLYTTTNGDRVLQRYLIQLGATLPGATDAGARPASDTALADEPPEQIVVNQPVTLGFTLKQNFKIVPVSLARDGDPQRVLLAAAASGDRGHYVFTYTFAQAGLWNWYVRPINYQSEIPMPPLEVIDTTGSAAVPPVRTSPAFGTTETTTAAVPSAPDPFSLPVALVAAALGIVGIAGVILMQNRRR